MIKSFPFCSILPALIGLIFILPDALRVMAFSAIGSGATVRALPINWSHLESLGHIDSGDEHICRMDDFEESAMSRRAAIRNAVLVPAATAVFDPFPAVAYPGELITSTETDFDCLKDLPPIEDGYVRLYLCRHGQTENNRLRIVQGARVDPPVNINGEAQATNLGLALGRADPKPELFFSSSLLRAEMTAEIAANANNSASSRNRVKPRQLSALAEIDFGPMADGQPISAVQNKMQKVYIEWATGNVNFRPEGGGDTGREVRQHSAIVMDVLLLYCRVFGWSLKS